MRHIGIYAYRAGFINTYINWEPSTLEKIEALEQLRVLWLRREKSTLMWRLMHRRQGSIRLKIWKKYASWSGSLIGFKLVQIDKREANASRFYYGIKTR